MSNEVSGEYSPLFVGGKRDKARRYVDTSGNIISRREYIKVSEGTTPELKAYRRYKEGKAPRGKTVRKVEKQRERRSKGGVGDKPTPAVKEKDMYEHLRRKGKPVKRQNTYQLQGEYEFYSAKLKTFGTAIGYSTHTRGARTGIEFLILREQAVNYAKAQLPFSGWDLVSVEWEQWLKW